MDCRSMMWNVGPRRENDERTQPTRVYGPDAVGRRGSAAGRCRSVCDHSALGPLELLPLVVDLIGRVGYAGLERVQLVAGVVRGDERGLEIGGADSCVGSTAHADPVAIGGLAIFLQTLLPSLLIQAEVRADAVLGAGLAVLGDPVA